MDANTVNQESTPHCLADSQTMVCLPFLSGSLPSKNPESFDRTGRKAHAQF
jgi:hypothetical protein